MNNVGISEPSSTPCFEPVSKVSSQPASHEMIYQTRQANEEEAKLQGMPGTQSSAFKSKYLTSQQIQQVNGMESKQSKKKQVKVSQEKKYY